MEDYRYRLSENMSDKWRNDIIVNTEIIFSSIYIAEFIIKVLGMGLIFEKGSYLRDYWNILDFTIVCSRYTILTINILNDSPFIPTISIVNLLPIPVYFMGLKTLRILRPLRSINSVKGTLFLFLYPLSVSHKSNNYQA